MKCPFFWTVCLCFGVYIEVSLLTHHGPVMPCGVPESLCRLWFRQWPVTYLVPSHYLNQWWFIGDWTLWTTLSEIWIRMLHFSLKEMDLKMSSEKCTPLWQPLCMWWNIEGICWVVLSLSNLVSVLAIPFFLNSSPPGQNGCHFADDIFRCIFLNENFCILFKISLKFVPKGPIDNISTLV